MKSSMVIVVLLVACLMTACQKKEPLQSEPTQQQKETAKEIRKGKFEPSSGKKW